MCKGGEFRSLRANFRVFVTCTMKALSWPNVGNDMHKMEKKLVEIQIMEDLISLLKQVKQQCFLKKSNEFPLEGSENLEGKVTCKIRSVFMNEITTRKVLTCKPRCVLKWTNT